MNILMLAPLPPPTGGIASWTIRYKEYCDANNISLRIVNIAMQGKRATSEVMSRNIITELKRTKNIIKNLRHEIKKEKPDVIHVNTSCSPLGVLRDALCVFINHKRIPLILHCRCNIEDQLGNSIISKSAFRYIVRKASKVIVLNKFSKKYVDYIVEGKSICVPNFINDKLMDKNHIIHNEIQEIIYVGHIERAKGIVQIAETASLLPNVSFLLLGAIREDISNINLPSNISIIGRVPAERVNVYLKNADVFIFPSMSEGFSNAVLEAMAMGLPVVASDVGANSEMIENKGGIIVHDNNGQSLYNAIVAMKDPGVRKKMSEWNIQKVYDNYMIENVMDMYLRLYESVTRKDNNNDSIRFH